MKRFLISFFVILIIPKLLIADACFKYLKFDWNFLGSGKASYNLSNTSKVNDIKVSMISLKNEQSKVIQVHSPMIIVKKNESRKKLYFSAAASTGLILFGLIIFLNILIVKNL